MPPNFAGSHSVLWNTAVVEVGVASADVDAASEFVFDSDDELILVLSLGPRNELRHPAGEADCAAQEEMVRRVKNPVGRIGQAGINSLRVIRRAGRTNRRGVRSAVEGRSVRTRIAQREPRSDVPALVRERSYSEILRDLLEEATEVEKNLCLAVAPGVHDDAGPRRPVAWEARERPAALR